jgi:hypothetical protein
MNWGSGLHSPKRVGVYMQRLVKLFGASIVAAGLLALPTAASATVTIVDEYYGGINTWNQGSNHDVIGDSNFFVDSAVFARVNGGGTLRVTINTRYAGLPGTGPAHGTGYGALFITPGVNAWSPTGTGPHYESDVYQPGDWAFAFGVPMLPGVGVNGGSANLYATSSGTIVMSNVNGNEITYPINPSSGYYFRQGQAVQFNPGQGAAVLGSGTWAADPIGDKMVFDINDGGLLGNNFAFSWAMTCANDIIQGQVLGVPEPGTWALMILGFGAAGVSLRRRKAAAAA